MLSAKGRRRSIMKADIGLLSLLASASGLLLSAACVSPPGMKSGEAPPAIESDIAAVRPTGPRIATPLDEIAMPPGHDAPMLAPPVEASLPAAGPPDNGEGGAAGVVPGDPRIGRSFVLNNCRPCHVVAADQSSSVRFANAPNFQTIAKAPRTTPFGLNIWLTNPHPTMPTLQLTSAEAANVIAYIMSLRN
jgi:cytochrome c